jgi:hypothetical protein
MQHRSVVSPHGLIFFCIASLFVVGLLVVPAVAQDDGSGPPAGTPAPGSNPDSPSSPPDLVTIQAEGCTVSEGASVTLEDGDGTTARFVDGQRGIEITVTGNQISIQGPNDDFIGDHAVETSDPGFDTDGDYAVVSTTGISCQGTGGTRADTDGGCPGARAVETLTGTASSRTPEFNITGTSFRVRFDVTMAGNPPLTITVLDENGGVVETLRVDQEGTGSFLVNQGPGRFVVQTDATGADYTITVEDCTRSGQQGDGGNTGGNNTGNAAETQYATDGKEVTVIVETIPNKRVLVDTGGPILPIIGGVILAIGLVGLGIFLLRRT